MCVCNAVVGSDQPGFETKTMKKKQKTKKKKTIQPARNLQQNEITNQPTNHTNTSTQVINVRM